MSTETLILHAAVITSGMMEVYWRPVEVKKSMIGGYGPGSTLTGLC